jgi:hypothetical protein
MRRLALCGVVAVAALLGASGSLAASTASQSPASTRAGNLVITKRALLPGASGSGYAEYGLILSNPTSRDALDVPITVTGSDSKGRAVVTDNPTVTLVPAGKSVVVAGELVWGVPLDVSRMSVKVGANQWSARGRGLPPVHGVKVAADGDAVGVFTNPYGKPMPSGASMLALFLDAAGHIVGVDAENTDASIPPHATVPFDLSGNYNTIEQADSVRSAVVTIDPCGYDAGTPACPVPGATG